MSKMNYENPQTSNNHQKEMITNIVLIVLSIAFVINLFSVIFELADIATYSTKDEDFIWFKLSEGQYAEMVADNWQNQFRGKKETEGLKQCYAITEYYEAASLYKVAVAKGNEKDKEKYAAVMEKNLECLDDVLFIIEDINELFDIE